MKVARKYFLGAVIVLIVCLLFPVLSQLCYHFTPEKAIESYISDFPTCMLPLKSPSVNDHIEEIYGSYDISYNERLFVVKAGEYTQDLYVTVCKVGIFFNKELYKASGNGKVILNEQDTYEYDDKEFVFNIIGEKNMESLLISDDLKLNFEETKNGLVVVTIQSWENSDKR